MLVRRRSEARRDVRGVSVRRSERVLQGVRSPGVLPGVCCEDDPVPAVSQEITLDESLQSGVLASCRLVKSARFFFTGINRRHPHVWMGRGNQKEAKTKKKNFENTFSREKNLATFFSFCSTTNRQRRRNRRGSSSLHFFFFFFHVNLETILLAAHLVPDTPQ